MVLEVNGVDMIPYIAHGGLKYQRTDVDGEGAGRDLSGDLRRNRVASKVRWDVTCRPLEASELGIVLRAIKPEWVTVNVYDPEQEAVVTRTMYANNNPASFCIIQPDGTEWWSGVTFPLIEK